MEYARQNWSLVQLMQRYRLRFGRDLLSDSTRYDTRTAPTLRQKVMFGSQNTSSWWSSQRVRADETIGTDVAIVPKRQNIYKAPSLQWILSKFFHRNRILERAQQASAVHAPTYSTSSEPQCSQSTKQSLSKSSELLPTWRPLANKSDSGADTTGRGPTRPPGIQFMGTLSEKPLMSETSILPLLSWSNASDVSPTQTTACTALVALPQFSTEVAYLSYPFDHIFPVCNMNAPILSTPARVTGKLPWKQITFSPWDQFAGIGALVPLST